MTLHKLNPARQPPEPRHINVGVSFQHELYNLVRCAVHRKLEQVFDDLALNMNLTASVGCHIWSLRTQVARAARA
jgi:hypothetical protein